MSQRSINLMYRGVKVELELPTSFTLEEIQNWIKNEEEFTAILKQGGVIQKFTEHDVLLFRSHNQQSQPALKKQTLDQYHPETILTFYIQKDPQIKVKKNSKERPVYLIYRGATVDIQLPITHSLEHIQKWIKSQGGFTAGLKEEGIVEKFTQNDVLVFRFNNQKAKPARKQLTLEQYHPSKKLIFYISKVPQINQPIKIVHAILETKEMIEPKITKVTKVTKETIETIQTIEAIETIKTIQTIQIIETKQGTKETKETKESKQSKKEIKTKLQKQLLDQLTQLSIKVKQDVYPQDNKNNVIKLRIKPETTIKQIEETTIKSKFSKLIYKDSSNNIINCSNKLMKVRDIVKSNGQKLQNKQQITIILLKNIIID